ncbi:HAD hydrolase, family IA [Coccidioides immitis RS]|uniref:HAD hydrolase, family IA n=4 Tax=Coccidioides TaxID=5500 RepID=A0A0E1RUL3_COCIM|nr:HAD hydrolase, family IA [Coccidioides immitis RS]EAS27895.2 HAD hydrolase, family IA [Coccidioides immitis RS]KMP08690.1 hypothetical protein CIRG_08371 [Coccidioides immitis RMSCC 2394]
MLAPLHRSAHHHTIRLFSSHPFNHILHYVSSPTATRSSRKRDMSSAPQVRAQSEQQQQRGRMRRFAPLNPEVRVRLGSGGTAPDLKGVVFDVDGTLCLPQHYMFQEMRSALGIDKSVDIITHIRGLPTQEERTAAAAKVQAIERSAMVKQKPQPGLTQLMDYLHSRGMKRALCTRNFEAPVTHLLTTHLPTHVFTPIVTRDTPDLMPKPDPAGILHIAKEWGLENGADDLIMVGDSLDDMTAGHKAGAATVLLVNDRNQALKEHDHTNLWIERLDDLIDILENGFVSPGED